jgi:hypothetical protein
VRPEGREPLLRPLVRRKGVRDMQVRVACSGSIKCSFSAAVSRPVALKVGSLFDQLNVYQFIQKGLALTLSLPN